MIDQPFAPFIEKVAPMRDDPLYLLGTRAITSFEIGSAPDVQILRMPGNPPLCPSDSYRAYLNAALNTTSRHPQIGAAFDPTTHFDHIHCRNRFCLRGDSLFEGFASSIRILNAPATPETWNHIVPAISTRSVCTGLSVNASMTFGVARTLTAPVVFSIVPGPAPRFSEVHFLETLTRTADACSNDFLYGESLFLSTNGVLSLFGDDVLIRDFGIPGAEPFENGAVAFAGHPRIAAASSPDEVRIFDIREDDPADQSVKAEVAGVSAILSIDVNQIAVCSHDGLALIDLRFPSRLSSEMGYHFSGAPISLDHRHFGDFSCVIAHSSESSEVVFFPFNQVAYAAPVRPFDTTLLEYCTADREFLTGVAITDDTAFLQFETGTIVRIELLLGQPPARQFLSSFHRIETEGPQDAFTFNPTFSPLPPDNPDPIHVHWNSLFSPNDLPPSSLLTCPPPAAIDDAGAPGYLIDVDDALDIAEEDVPMALQFFWKNHIDRARSRL
jgi:hypothetical protein